MKRTLFLFLLCCLLPLGARAEGLWLDGAHAYEGMERSYDMGYSPEEVGNALRVVLLASLGNLAGGLLMPAAAAWKCRLMQKPRRAAASEGAPAQRPGPPGPTIERERAFTSKREE